MLYTMLTVSVIILVISSILYSNHFKINENFTYDTIHVFDEEDENKKYDNKEIDKDYPLNSDDDNLAIESDEIIVTDSLQESKKINKNLEKRLKREQKKLKMLMQKNDANKKSRKNQLYSIFKTGIISLIIVIAVVVGCKMVSNKT